jgi:superfamily II RNA helicase
LKERAEIVEYERDQANEQVQLTEEEIANERQLREDLRMRLLELESKFMGEGGKVDLGKSSKGESVEQQKEREAVESAFQERKARAKRRRDVRDKQLQKVLNEKQVGCGLGC